MSFLSQEGNCVDFDRSTHFYQRTERDGRDVFCGVSIRLKSYSDGRGLLSHTWRGTSPEGQKRVCWVFPRVKCYVEKGRRMMKSRVLFYMT